MNNIMRLPLSSGNILNVLCEPNDLGSGFESSAAAVSALAHFTKPNTLFQLDEFTYLLVNDILANSYAMEISLTEAGMEFQKLVLISDLPENRKLSYAQEHGDPGDGTQRSNFIIFDDTIYPVSREAKAFYLAVKGEVKRINGSHGPWLIAQNKENSAYTINLSGFGDKVHLSEVIEDGAAFDAVVAAEYRLFTSQYCLVTLDFEDHIIRGVIERQRVKSALPSDVAEDSIPLTIRAKRLTKKRMWIYETEIQERKLLIFFKPNELPLEIVDVTDSELVKAVTTLNLAGIGTVSIPTSELYQLLEGRDMSVGEMISKNSAYPLAIHESISSITTFFEKYPMSYLIEKDGYFKFRHVRNNIYNLSAKMNKREIGINVTKESDDPPQYKFHQRIMFDPGVRYEDQLNIRKLVDRSCLANNYRQTINIQFYDDNQLSGIDWDECTLDVFRILDTGEKAVALFATQGNKAYVALGWEHKLGCKIQIHHTDVVQLSEQHDVLEIVSQCVAKTYDDFRLDLPEIRNLPEHRGITKPAPVKRIRSIQTYTHQSKTECYVDLTYSLGNTTERVRYNILGRDHTSSRNLKACAEAMAIRNFLITRMGTSAKVMVGSQSLRLKVSSAKLYRALKGDLSNFMHCNDWHFVRYLLTRAYDTPVTLENVKPAGLPHSQMYLHLGRDHQAMKLEECLNIGSNHYMITYHAVQRSAERMELRTILSGWGFITQQILRACCTPEEEGLVNCRYNEEAKSTSRVTPNGWTYVTKPDEHQSDLLNVVTTFKGAPDKRLEAQSLWCATEI